MLIKSNYFQMLITHSKLRSARVRLKVTIKQSSYSEEKNWCKWCCIVSSYEDYVASTMIGKKIDSSEEWKKDNKLYRLMKGRVKVHHPIYSLIVNCKGTYAHYYHTNLGNEHIGTLKKFQKYNLFISQQLANLIIKT